MQDLYFPSLTKITIQRSNLKSHDLGQIACPRVLDTWHLSSLQEHCIIDVLSPFTWSSRLARCRLDLRWDSNLTSVPNALDSMTQLKDLTLNIPDDYNCSFVDKDHVGDHPIIQIPQLDRLDS